MQIKSKIFAFIAAKLQFMGFIASQFINSGKRSVERNSFIFARKRTKSVYILGIYTERGTFLQFQGKYPMGILWVFYGYPMGGVR